MGCEQNDIYFFEHWPNFFLSDFWSSCTVSWKTGARNSGLRILESEVSPPLPGHGLGLGNLRPEVGLELRQHRARRRRQSGHPFRECSISAAGLSSCRWVKKWQRGHREGFFNPDQILFIPIVHYCGVTPWDTGTASSRNRIRDQYLHSCLKLKIALGIHIFT